MYEWRVKALMIFLHVQHDLKLHILHMFEGTFWLDAGHIRAVLIVYTQPHLHIHSTQSKIMLFTVEIRVYKNVQMANRQ